MTTKIVSHARETFDDVDAELLRRARAMVAELGRYPTPKERLWFIVGAREDDLFVRGHSAGLLADVWGCQKNTVERSAAEAQHMLERPDDVAKAREVISLEARRRSDEIYERARFADARAAGSMYQAANASLETFGKATGAISSGPQVTLLVDPRGVLRPDAKALLEAACRAATSLGCDPVAFRLALAGETAQQVPSGALEALALPPPLAGVARARVLVETLAEAWPDGDEGAELVPVLKAMVEDDDG